MRIANNNMINALKLVSLNRGYDPRDFTLVAFGGGGGMHAAALAAELGCRKVVIPRGASVLSAWGMMMSDLRRDYFATRLIEIGGDSLDAAAAALDALITQTGTEAKERFMSEGVEESRLARKALIRCRYQNQEHAVEVPLGTGAVDAAAVARLVEDFHLAYEREYTYRLKAPVEIVGLHLVATAAVEKLAFAKQPATGARIDAALKGRRMVAFSTEGEQLADIYDAARLEPRMAFDGPAIIEEPGTTIVIHPGQRATIDCYGNTQIEMPDASTDAA